MEKGQKIKWQYTDHLNTTSSVECIKTGIYLRAIRHTVRYGGVQLAFVKFDGNKRPSKVPQMELKFNKYRY